MKFGSRIKELRGERGLTQEALADVLDVTPQTVSKWECGINYPEVSQLTALSVFFGVPIDDLFTFSAEDKLERISNAVASGGLFSDDEVKSMESELLSEDLEGEERAAAYTLLAKLYNHQAREMSKIAAKYSKDALDITENDKAPLSELSRSCGGASFGILGCSHRELIRYLREYIGRCPSSQGACAMLIDNLLSDARVDEATMWTDHLERIDGTYRTLGYKYAIASLRGDEDIALAAISILDAEYSDDPGALMLLADIRVMRGEYEAARECALRASKLAKKDLSPYLAAAQISEFLGDIDGALTVYREVLTLLKEEWGVVSGEPVSDIRREINRLSGKN